MAWVLGRRLLPANTSIIGAGLVTAWTFSGPLACAPTPARDASSEEAATDWNASAINWRDYAAGLAEARTLGKPIVLIFYTDWCPHCHNYSRVFHDPELVLLTNEFVMIRVERDGHPELSARYDLDGDYVPRTFFLSASGVVQSELAGDNPAFHYFLDEHEPDELIDLMERALGG